MKNGKEKSMFVREYLWRDLMTVCGLFVILLTIVIGAFLVYKGSATFLVYKHSFLEFLGSADWAPEDNMTGGGSIGALIFIVDHSAHADWHFSSRLRFPLVPRSLLRRSPRSLVRSSTARWSRSLQESRLLYTAG